MSWSTGSLSWPTALVLAAGLGVLAAGLPHRSPRGGTVGPVSRRIPGAAAARALSRLLARGYRGAVTRGAALVVVVWLAAAVLLPLLLGTPSTGGGDMGGLLPANSHALQVEKQALKQFRVPVLSETSVVVHDPNGLSPLTRADVVAWALSYTQRYLDGTARKGLDHIIAAEPIPTATKDTAVTYLYVSSGTSTGAAFVLARQYAAHFANQPSVTTYVTGLGPAEVSQEHYLQSRLDLFAIASVALIAVVVTLTFRSVGAALLVLGVAAVGYEVARPLLGVLADAFGFPVPSQLEPLIVALLLGVVTDYSVLLASTFREQARAGGRGGAAVRATLLHDAGIIAVAGLTVAGGTISLLAANLQLFRAFGPALALTVLVGVLVSLTLTPAVMTLVGRRLVRVRPRGAAAPGTAGPGTAAPGTADAAAAPDAAVAPDRAPGTAPDAAQRPTRGAAVGLLVRAVSDRRGAAVAVLLGLGLLVLAAAPALHMRLDLSFSSGLPHSDQVRRGAAVLDRSGIRGVTGPTEIIVRSPGIADHRAELERLQAAVAAQPGVAQVLGPAQNPLPDRFGVVLSRDGNAARLIVILDSDPLGAPAIADLNRLAGRLDRLAATAGLPAAHTEVTGLTAIAGELADATRVNLRLTLLVALAVELIILVTYLGALVAPIALLACSAVGVSAALGLTTLFFQSLLGDPGLTFYVPFATAVLLFALGSDYNVFAVGTIWDEAARHPLRRALAIAVPRSSRAITAAGLILAATFAMVAIIPLESFREVAFTMGVGLLIDTFLVRPVLTPAVLSLLGRAAGWPGRRIRTADPASPGLRRQEVGRAG